MGYKILLLVVLLMTLGLNTSVQAWISINATPTQGVVSVDTLNLRDEPSVDGEIIGVLHLGDKVDILEWNNWGYGGDREYNWVRIRFGDQVGFISSGRATYADSGRYDRDIEYYLTLVKFTFFEQDEWVCDSTPLEIVVIVDSLNLRSIPSVEGEILDTLVFGDQPEILRWGWRSFGEDYPEGHKGYNQDYLWVEVYFEGQTGFIAAEETKRILTGRIKEITEHNIAVIDRDGCG